MENIHKFWDDIAHNNPYHGVITDKKFLNDNFKNYEHEFWNSGKEDTEFMLDYLKRKNIYNDIKCVNMIELGTGTGRIASHMIQYCNLLYCVDISEKYLQITKNKFDSLNYHNYKLVNYNDFYSINFSYDTIL